MQFHATVLVLFVAIHVSAQKPNGTRTCKFLSLKMDYLPVKNTLEDSLDFTDVVPGLRN